MEEYFFPVLFNLLSNHAEIFNIYSFVVSFYLLVCNLYYIAIGYPITLFIPPLFCACP